MRKLLILSCILTLLLVAGGFAFSNYIRPLGNPNYPSIDIAAYDFNNDLSEDEHARIKDQVLDIKGVKGVRVGSTNITVTIDSELSNREVIEQELQNTIDDNIQSRVYTAGSGKTCPVTGPDSFGQTVAKIFRF